MIKSSNEKHHLFGAMNCRIFPFISKTNKFFSYFILNKEKRLALIATQSVGHTLSFSMFLSLTVN